MMRRVVNKLKMAAVEKPCDMNDLLLLGHEMANDIALTNEHI